MEFWNRIKYMFCRNNGILCVAASLTDVLQKRRFCNKTWFEIFSCFCFVSQIPPMDKGQLFVSQTVFAVQQTLN